MYPGSLKTYSLVAVFKTARGEPAEYRARNLNTTQFQIEGDSVRIEIGNYYAKLRPDFLHKCITVGHHRVIRRI